MKRFISLSIFTALLFSIGTCSLMSCSKELSCESSCDELTIYVVQGQAPNTFSIQPAKCDASPAPKRWESGDTTFYTLIRCHD